MATTGGELNHASDTPPMHFMKRRGSPSATSEAPRDTADTRVIDGSLIEATLDSSLDGAGDGCLLAPGWGLTEEPPGGQSMAELPCPCLEDEHEWTEVRKRKAQARSASLCGRKGPVGPEGTGSLVEDCFRVAGGRPSISPPIPDNEGRLTSTLSGNRFELLYESTSTARGSGEEETVKPETKSPGGGSLSSPSGRCFTKGPELSQLPGVAGHNAESSGWLEAVKGDATPASAEEAAGQHGGTRSLSAVLLPAISSCASWLLVERRHGSSVLVSTARHLWVRPR